VRRRRDVFLSAGAAVLIFLIADAFGAPSVHDIHSSDGIPIRIQIPDVESSFGGPARAIKASQSLSDVRCQVWLMNRPSPCPDEATLASAYWPKLTQSPRTLYVGWSPCGEYWNDPLPKYLGFNVEYVQSQRTVLIHCHLAKPWIHGPAAPGVRTTGALVLVLIPTDFIRAGNLSIVQEDRIEHLFGDQVTDFAVATATIS
jgi:hypothetical protein